MSEPLDVGRLRLLREVELRGSIAGAARSLALTPSAVSQQLAVLEREAGTALLDRSTRGVVLTGAGHLLAQHAAAILDRLGAARAELDLLGGETGGPVTVAAVASAAATIVSDAAVRLRTSHPGIDLRVRAAEPRLSVALLAGGDADVAIVDEYDYVPLALPDHVQAIPLLVEPLVLVRAGGSGGRDGDALEMTDLADLTDLTDLAELAGLDWVMPPEDAACGTAVRAACRAAGFEPRVRWETDDMLLLVRAVAAGHGVAVLPWLAVATGAGTASVSVHRLSEPVPRRRLTALVRSSAQGRPVIRALIAALLESTDQSPNMQVV
jgi:DNA-binding transcriptional LysR family regulator